MEKRLYSIPYFYGKLVKQPYIKLRNRAEGFEVWVINTHNPADSRGPAQQYRNRAMAIQVELANRLQQSGLPVFLVGDFNETSEAFCWITGQTDLKAANGGTLVRRPVPPAPRDARGLGLPVTATPGAGLHRPPHRPDPADHRPPRDLQRGAGTRRLIGMQMHV